jgi:hypothetical protein
MSAIMKGIGGVLVGIYFLVFAIATPYFNWQYATEHGFIKWFLLGQFVPTIQAAVWPYYAYDYFTRRQPTLPEKKAVEAVFRSHGYLSGALQLTRSIMAGSSDIKGDFAKIQSLIEASRQSISECDPAVLNTIYAGWGDTVSQTFTPGVKYYQAGLQPHEDRVNLARGDALLAEYQRWMDKNKKPLFMKLKDAGFEARF